VVLHEVRVVGRRRRHREHLPRPRIERDDSPTVRPELVEGGLLRIDVQVEDDVVADDRLPAELVEGFRDDRREVRVRGRQVVVERALEPRAGLPDGRIADDLRGEPALGVATEVEGLASDRAAAVAREASEGGSRKDQAAVDRELGHALDRVVLTVGKARGGPGLPVRRHRDERPDEDQRDVGEADDLPVHFGVFARLETRRSRARRRKLATMLVPP
jgi:hypothetical protein